MGWGGFLVGAIVLSCSSMPPGASSAAASSPSSPGIQDAVRCTSASRDDTMVNFGRCSGFFAAGKGKNSILGSGRMIPPMMGLLRLRGGIMIGQLVKQNNVKDDEIDWDALDRMYAAAEAGESTDNWTSDSSAREEYKRESAKPGFFPSEYELMHPDKPVKKRTLVVPPLSDEDDSSNGERDGSDRLEKRLDRGEQKRALEQASALAKQEDAVLDLKAAESGKGNARQMFNLGAKLASEGNLTAAVKWFRRSARGGHTKAEYNLGACLVKGISVKRDVAAGAKMLEVAVDKGHTGAMLLLGKCYLEGVAAREGVDGGFVKDERKGVKLITKAAGLNQKDAQYALALCCLQGRGLRRDRSASKHWMGRAADGGHAEAAYLVGKMHEEDGEVSRAQQLWEQAADRGHAEAQYLCGMKALKAHASLAADPACSGDVARASKEEGEGEGEGEGKARPAAAVAVDRLQAAADQGHPKASLELAGCFLRGLGTVRDVEEGARLLQQAASSGELAAYGALGKLYARGEGVAGGKDMARAEECFRMAAEAGDVSAMVNLGFMCAQGNAQEDQEEAFRQFERAARKGDAVAMCNLATLYREGKGVEKNEVKCTQWMCKAAEIGDVDAQLAVAKMFADGDGVLQDSAMAAKWAKRAGNRGNAEACILAAQLAEARRSSSTVKAARWYHKAAKQGSVHAQVRLGGMLWEAKGIQADDKQAAHWLGLAASEGNMNATVLLGQAYLQGRGVAADHGYAVDLFRIAAKAGSRDACRALGLCYLEGKGMPKDVSKAIEKLTTAVDMDCLESCLILGGLLLSLDGSSHAFADEPKGFELLKRAADRGSLPALREVCVCYLKGRGVERDDHEAGKYGMLADQAEQRAAEENAKAGISLTSLGMTSMSSEETQESGIPSLDPDEVLADMKMDHSGSSGGEDSEEPINNQVKLSRKRARKS